MDDRQFDEFAVLCGELLRDFGWQDHICLTWCEGIDVREAAHRLGADMESGAPATVADVRVAVWAAARPSRYDLVVLGKLGTWTLLVEEMGMLGATPDVLSALSRDGRALNVHWHVNMSGRITYAVDGEIVSCFQTSTPEEKLGIEPGSLSAYGGGLRFGDGSEMFERRASALLLARRLTGERLTREWLDSIHSMYFIPS
ncbi:DUF6461 domain-containing protein [Streptosporangium canum]|uniref:DUF6461 domain-containing protein n=1 Tax=Streptosporangium canum TaxID=324952 RepID=UPI0037AA4C1D